MIILQNPQHPHGKQHEKQTQYTVYHAKRWYAKESLVQLVG